MIEGGKYDDKRNSIGTIYGLLRRERLVCRAEKRGQKSDCGTGDLEG